MKILRMEAIGQEINGECFAKAIIELGGSEFNCFIACEPIQKEVKR